MQDDTTHHSQPTQPLMEPPQPPEPGLRGFLHRPVVFGILSALVFSLPLCGAWLMGSIWLITVYSAINKELFREVLGPDLVRAAVYGLALLIPFTPVAVFLKAPRYKLWRGLALALALAGLHGLIGGLLLALDRWLDWPGLPYLTPAAAALLVAGLGLYLRRDYFFSGRPVAGPVLFGLAAGLLIAAGWGLVGVFGTWGEAAQAAAEAFGLALLLSVLAVLPFSFDEQAQTWTPLWGALLLGSTVMALSPAVLAQRGYWTQGLLLGQALSLGGFAAAMIVANAARQRPITYWLAALGFFFTALLIPLLVTEGLEGDWMPDELLMAWLPAGLWMAAGGLLVALIGLVVLGVRRWLPFRLVNPIPGALAAGVTSVALLAAYFIAGRPAPQPLTFLVVLEDQTDTADLADIRERDERVTAVYETLTEHAEASQADLRTLLERRGAPYRPFYLVNSIEVQGSALLRAQLAMRPDVAFILDSPQARPVPEPVLPELGEAPNLGGAQPPDPGEVTWGLEAMGVERVWADFEVQGDEIIVGIADSGTDWTHPALAGSYLGAEGDHDYHWFDPWEGTTEPTDLNGHGTHTAGTVAGADGIGVAPGARWIACRNLARNLGNPGDYLACMQFLFAPHPIEGDPFTEGDPGRGAHIVNNSWGCPPAEGCDGRLTGLGLVHLRHAGQMYVVSAGNDGPSCETIGEPGNNDDVFSVGAAQLIGDELAVTYFSSRGPAVDYDGDLLIKPDVTAPGESVVSAWPGDSYASLPGTSMAGPHVAGLAALIWSANPELIGNIDMTELIIAETAQPIAGTLVTCGEGTTEHNDVGGFGFVDAYAAVERAVEMR